MSDIYDLDESQEEAFTNKELSLDFTGDFLTKKATAVVLSTPTKSGIAAYTTNQYNFAANMKSYLRIPKDGYYTFHFGSQGTNAVMTIDGQETFKLYDRWNNMTRMQKTIYMTAGDHEWNLRWYAFRWVGQLEFKVNIDGEFEINDVPSTWFVQKQEKVPAATPGSLPTPIGTPTPCPIVETDDPGEDILYAYEGFDYDSESALSGLGNGSSDVNGGTGWSGGWSVQDANSEKPRAVIAGESALIYPGLKSTQNYAIADVDCMNVGRKINISNQNIPASLKYDSSYLGKANSAFWISALMQVNGTEDISFGLHKNGIAWYMQNGPMEDRSVQFGTFGGNSLNDAGKKVWTLRVNDKYVKTDVVAKVGETAFVAAEIHFDAETRGARIRMYVNPDITKPLGKADAEYRLWGQCLLVSNVHTGLGGKYRNGKIDEIRLGNTFRAVAPLSTFKLPVTKVEIWPANGDINSLKGGKIAGSNEGATIGFTDIYSIPDNITGEKVVLENKNITESYRYVKYHGALGTGAKVAEIKFYNGDMLLEGEAFGSDAKEGCSYENAFDGDVKTYYEGKLADNQYVGLDLGGETIVAEPVADPKPGRYEEPMSVSLTSSTIGADIYYTLDGTYPTKTNGIKYEDPIQLKAGDAVIIKAVAMKDGLIASGVFAGGYGIGTTAPVAKGLTTYHLGNSLTDTTNGMLEKVAQSANQNHVYMRWTIPGAGMPTLTTSKTKGFGTPWVDASTCDVSNVKTDKYSELFDSEAGTYFDTDTCVYAVDRYAPIDIMVVQPHSNGDTIENGVTYGKPLYDKARESNPNIRYLVYSSWGALPKYDGDTTFATWLEKYMTLAEGIADGMNALYTDDPNVDVVPNALALDNLRKAIEAGKMPGVDKDAFTAFASANTATDTSHMNTNGAYFINLVTYTVMYKQNPVNTVTYKPDEMSEEQAAVLKQIAWDTCRNYAYANVSAETIPTAKPTNEATVKPTQKPTATPAPTVTVKPTETETVNPTATTSDKVDTTVAPTVTPISTTPTVTTEPTESEESSVKKVKRIKFVKKSVKVKKGKKAVLKVKLTPAEGLSKKYRNVKWSIDKKGKKVIKFAKKAKRLNGKLKIKIKALKKGKAKVTCKAPSGKKAVCKVIVR